VNSRGRESEGVLAALEREAREYGWVRSRAKRRLPICIHTLSGRPARTGGLAYFTSGHQSITRDEALERLRQGVLALEFPDSWIAAAAGEGGLND